MKIHQIINNFHTSNTYILELTDSKVLLIDVGDFDQIEDWLKTNNKEVHSVILTHEHSDHCHGLNELYDLLKFDLYCSKMCAMNIANKRQNFSLYIDELEDFEISVSDTNIIQDMDSVNILGHTFKFIVTPGHSPGSTCIVIKDKIFTGDTILNGVSTPLNLPHSNRNDYYKSIEKLKSIIEVGMTIFPGHDIPFRFRSFEELAIAKKGNTNV